MSENNKKAMSNKVKIIVGLISLLIILLIVGGLAIYPVVDTNTRFQQVKDGYDNDVFYGVRQCLYKGGYSSFIDRSDKQSLFLQGLNLTNPVYVVIKNVPKSEDTNNRFKQHLTFIHFQRTDLFSFKPVKTQPGTIYNTTWEEATKILQNNNLLQINPDPENIKIFEPTPDEELAKIAQQYCNQPEEQQTESKDIVELSTDEIIQGNKEYEIYIKKITEEKVTATEERKEEIDYEIFIFGEFIKTGKEELQKRGVVE